MKALKLAGLAGALVITGAAQAATITFDEFTHNGYYTEHNGAVVGGFQFVNDHGTADSLIAWGADHGYNMDAGGATLSHNYGFSTTTVTKAGGGTFDLYSIDLGDIFNGAAGGDVLFVFAGANETVQVVTLDSLAGGETFVFNQTGLTSFSFQGVSTTGGWLQFDNVVTDFAGGIPEPSSWALLILGFGLTGAAMRRRSTTARLGFAA